jgi:hypothetical protein
LDKVTDQYDRNELRYIMLEECTRRDQELEGVKRDDVLRIEIKKDDSLKLEREPTYATARLASDLEVKNAFIRRALAYDAAGLITFSVHELWINKLFRIMQEATVEGHQAVSLQQAYRADKKLWQKMGAETVGNIQPILGRPKPLDVAMQKFCDAVEVTFLLLPLPASYHSSSAVHSASSSTPNTIQVSSAKAGKEERNRQQPYSKQKGGKGAGKGGKGAKADRPTKVSNDPRSQGCSFYLSNGKPCCIFFNSKSGCNTKNITVGKRCARGFHNCGKVLSSGIVCSGEHAMSQCTK